MPFIHIVLIWELTLALADKLSIKHASNAHSTGGCSTAKPGNVWVFFSIYLDHDGKAVMAKTIEYDDEFGNK
jgi:hypothetical protein